MDHEAGEPRLSIYLPGGTSETKAEATVRASKPSARGTAEPDGPQSPMRARIRAAARDAQATLRKRYPREVAEALLQPIHALTRNRRFLAQPMPGLSIFVNPERARAVPLLDPVRPAVALDGRFYFGPLLPQLSSDAVFWILVLDRHRPLRLLQATAREVRELSAEDLPGEVAHKLWPPSPERTPEGSGGFEPGAMRRVAGALDRLLARRHQPLVLAGPTALREAFRAASHYPLTLYFGLELASGEAAALASLQSLREQAWSLVAPRFHEAQRDAVSEVREAAGTALSDADPARVLRQAQRGLVEHVVLADPREAGTAAPPPPPSHPRDRDEETTLHEQLSRIALYGRMHRSSVFVVPPDQVPGGGVVAARYRHVP
jgi:hypothetical protein